MSKENTAISIYANPDRIEEAVMELEGSGFDMKRISVIGKVSGDQPRLTALYEEGHSLKCRGRQSDLWNKLCALIRDWVLFNCPDSGALLAIGPVSLWIVAVIDNSAIFSNLSVLGAMLYSMGLAKESLQDYEEALRKGGYLLIVHGPSQEVTQAKRILKSADRRLSHDRN